MPTPGFEADDFLAAAAAAEEKRGGSVLVASGDRDTFQLASDHTSILYPLRAGEMARIGPAEVRARLMPSSSPRGAEVGGDGIRIEHGVRLIRRNLLTDFGFRIDVLKARGLSQSMARELSPRGIHVAHFVIDGGIRNAVRTLDALDNLWGSYF